MAAPFALPYRTAPDSLDAIRADLDAMLGRVDRAQAEPDPSLGLEAVEALCRKSRELFTRRALEEAADHAAALLPLLGLPRLVGPGFAPIDREAAGNALDAAVTALDALDADPDLEDDEREAEGLDEPTLGAPENHPARFLFDMDDRLHKGGRHHALGDQTAWAAGIDADADVLDQGESEAGYDLPEGDDERDGDGSTSGDAGEPSLGCARG